MQYRNETGFTLLEVLIAFTILALVTMTIFQTFGGGLSAVATAQKNTLVLAVLRSKLEAVGADIPLKTGVIQGVEVSGVSWEVEIRPYDGTPEIFLNRGMQAYWVRAAASQRLVDNSSARAISQTTLRFGRGG